MNCSQESKTLAHHVSLLNPRFNFYIRFADFPPAVHLRTEPMTESTELVFPAVISLLVVDRAGRIPLPSVIPLCHRLFAALSRRRPPGESPALLRHRCIPKAFDVCSGTQWITRLHRALSVVCDGQLNQCKPKLTSRKSMQKVLEALCCWEIPAKLFFLFSF